MRLKGLRPGSPGASDRRHRAARPTGDLSVRTRARDRHERWRPSRSIMIAAQRPGGCRACGARRNGLPSTTILTRAAHHPTAEEVYQAVRVDDPQDQPGHGVQGARSLGGHRRGDQAHRADGGDTSARYDARRDPHYHFRCLRTGAVHDLPTPFDPDLVAKLDPSWPTISTARASRSPVTASSWSAIRMRLGRQTRRHPTH